MQTQNREWGFYGTMARESTVPDELWDEAMDALTDPDGQFRLEPEIARDLLDSTWGRHFADECVGSRPRRILQDLAKNRRWMRSTLRVLEAISLARKDSGTNR